MALGCEKRLRGLEFPVSTQGGVSGSQGGESCTPVNDIR